MVLGGFSWWLIIIPLQVLPKLSIYSMKLGCPLTAHQQENATSYLPFSHLDIFHTLKFSTISLSNDIAKSNVIKARSDIASEPAHFDPAIILQGDDAEATGLQGKYIISSLISCVPTNVNFTTLTGVHAGHIKVIFKLLQTVYTHGRLNEINAPVEWAGRGPLVYVEWYANLPASADPVHRMYEVCKLPLHMDGMPAEEIIPLSMIRQSCQLIPHFPRPTRGSTISTIPSDLTSDSVAWQGTEISIW